MNDPFGQAVLDFYLFGLADDLIINTNYTENETIPVSYFFRGWNKMPETEQKALDLCRGNILDIGAAAGCHSIVLQNKGLQVAALEKSPLATSCLEKRGVSNIIQADIYDYDAARYDTLLLLMNGAGIGGTVSGLKTLLEHLRTLLKNNGRILIDSSDIKYIFEEDDGSFRMNLNAENYYGEMKYEVNYKNHFCVFEWLFIDSDLLKVVAHSAGLHCEIMVRGDHFDFLAMLTTM